MFRTGSPYSPFFTSGLLSDSRAPSPEPVPTPRRGSLPTDSTSVFAASASDASSAFYFTLQPKRDTSEYRSFLSLDLAESQSLRSASLKRTTKRCKVVPVASTSPIPEQRLAPPHAPLRVRHSRDSLRTIPSPKPAPSITLPEVPRRSESPPRLPSLAVSVSLGLSLERASHSAPSLTISRTSAPDVVVPLPNRCSVSSSVRRSNRSHALARLEGRTASTRRPKSAPKPFQRNFMSMSDDEDEDGDGSEFEFGLFPSPTHAPINAVLEPEDVVLPPPSPHHSGARSAPIGGRFPSSASSAKRKQAQRTTEWFPLKSFMDLQGDDDISRWSWRSFIEVASVS
ncbi:hypothetical protein H0H81_010939 [Sphagnurus paluster]|uniref:Uncharacterized protein n=1 Tax=Sphagnurus paluster TaxID=117069 RepID=A0A9P7GHS4_9AGAR|nr:hypothetical protein H0H81_010939 [Sphagnurus paluster]